MAESQSEFNIDRVRQLALEKCNGTLSEDGVAELSDLLASSERAREEYWQIMTIHSQLEWDLGGKIASSETVEKQMVDVVKSEAHGPKQTKVRRSTAWLLSIAACLLIAAFTVPWEWQDSDEERNPGGLVAQTNEQPAFSPVLGTLTPLVPQSSWSFGRPNGNNATAFRQGDTIWLEEGAVELRLTSNTTAVLESPVIMQLVSLNRVRVIQGGIKVEVAKGGEGFSVETASAEVIDLGTVFSVNVAGGNTDLVVYDGEVDLKLAGSADEADGNPQGLVKRFRAGQAVQVDGDGTLSRIVNVRQSTLLARGIRSNISPVITAVKDNNLRDDFWSFYEIVPAGMGEDAHSFVDRPYHEWNGITPEGMPSYLIGGDYVRTFNDDKVTDDLVINMTLERPATIYVLFDKRLIPPKWLLESFENTGDEIGVDEVPHYPDEPSRITASKVAVGPGKSINRRHSIWKRIVTEPAVVALGANGQLDNDVDEGPYSRANMYGVVVVPLAEANESG